MFLDRYDSYIILSFVNGTLALFIDETTEEVEGTGFLSAYPPSRYSKLTHLARSRQ